MSIEAPKVIPFRKGEKLTVIFVEERKPEIVTDEIRGDISPQTRGYLRDLITGEFGQLIHDFSFHDPDLEFGNIRAEREAAIPVVTALRDGKTGTRQVRDEILRIVYDNSVIGTADSYQRRAWANQATMGLKRFADQVLGEPDPADYRHQP